MSCSTADAWFPTHLCSSSLSFSLLSAAWPSFACPVTLPPKETQQHEVQSVQACTHVQMDWQAAAKGTTPCPAPSETGNDYFSPPVLMKLEILSSSP